VGAAVLDEVAEVAVFALADRAIEADRLAVDLKDPAGLFDADAGGFGGLFDRRLATLLLHELLADLSQLRHRLDHVDRNTNRPGLIGDRAGDRLSDPPRGIRAELIAPAVLVLVDGSHQAGVTFLNEIEEGQAAVAVFLRDR